MPRSVDVSDAAGQPILPDSTIGIPPAAVNPAPSVQLGNLSSGQGLNTNSQQRKLELQPVQVDSADVELQSWRTMNG